MIRADESTDPVIQATGAALGQEFTNLMEIQDPRQFDFTFDRDRWLVEVAPIQDEFGIDWLSVVVLPESAFMSQINANTRTTLLLSGAVLLLAIGVGIRVAAWIGDQVEQLSSASDKLAQGDLDSQVEVKGIAELESLGTAFNGMAQELQGSFQALEIANQELEKKVEQRTAALKQSEQRLRRQNEVLADLARNEALTKGEIQQAAIGFTEAVSKTLMVERVSIWLLNTSGTIATCLNLYQHRQKRHDSGSEWQRAAYPNYFMALEQRRIIAAENALQDPSTIEFAANYLTPLGIGASLEATIVVAGQVRGMIRCEHVGKSRRWSADEQSFITSVANLIALALEASERVKAQEELALSEQQQRQAKEALQQRAMELLMEVDPVSEGDLRIRARVTPDEIGTIADSYNSIIANLRDIVIQVQGATRQVNQTASASEQAVRILSADATVQADSLTQALGQIQVMVGSIQSVALRAKEAQIQVEQSNRVVKAGDTAMNRTVNGILGIRETVAETTKKSEAIGGNLPENFAGGQLDQQLCCPDQPAVIKCLD
ncbi:MAG: HAMP domain-containing protein [Synechococcaceae cyanobacterium SM2_3_2]|nr:HAMP domain-containing protein [Synechococcaceae cyanobacterium SM2_3_2]